MADINTNIKKINVGGTEYCIEALHFIASSTLDTPAQWKQYIDDMGAASKKLDIKVKDATEWNTAGTEPKTTASASTYGQIWLLPAKSGGQSPESGTYIEFITVNTSTTSTASYKWEKIGTTDTDLSEYALKGNYNTLASSAANTGSSATGIAVTSSGSHTASGSAAVTYKKSDVQTGSAGAGTDSNTSDAGAIKTTPTFYGKQATLSGSVTGINASSITITPSGSISGSQTIASHSHAFNASTATLTIVTAVNNAASAGAHTHAVDSHTHSGSGTASVVTNWNGGSLTGTTSFNTDAIKNVKLTAGTTAATGAVTYVESVTHTAASLTGTKTFNTDAMKASVANGILTLQAAGTGTVGISGGGITPVTRYLTGSGDAASKETVGLSGATCTISSSSSFALAATAAELTAASAGSHTHTVGGTTATLTYVNGGTIGKDGGATVDFTKASFTGAEITFTPSIGNGSFSITYTPEGTISEISVAAHHHTYSAPSAHTHSISLTDTSATGTASVTVADHTHTISDTGHTHTMAHTHTVTI